MDSLQLLLLLALYISMNIMIIFVIYSSNCIQKLEKSRFILFTVDNPTFISVE